jgi:hypothetical protein
VNIYSPLDILASNFRDDGAFDEASGGISFSPPKSKEAKVADKPTRGQNLVMSDGKFPDEVSTISWLGLLGLRAHAMYWDQTEDKYERTCFNHFMEGLRPVTKPQV